MDPLRSGAACMSEFRTATVATLLIALLGGCLATPRLASPGNEYKQQARAQIFEPYPEPDIGPPVVGARPHEYQTPRAEFCGSSRVTANRCWCRFSPTARPPVLAPPAVATPVPPTVAVPAPQ